MVQNASVQTGLVLIGEVEAANVVLHSVPTVYSVDENALERPRRKEYREVDHPNATEANCRLLSSDDVE